MKNVLQKWMIFQIGMENIWMRSNKLENMSIEELATLKDKYEKKAIIWFYSWLISVILLFGAVLFTVLNVPAINELSIYAWILIIVIIIIIFSTGTFVFLHYKKKVYVCELTIEQHST